EYELTGATQGTGTSLDGVLFKFGVTTVTWTATDSSGNIGVCSFNVNVYSLDCIPRKVIIISPDYETEIIRVSIPPLIITNSVVLNDINGIDTGLLLVNGEIDISSLPSGMYFLIVDTNIGKLNQTVIKP